MKKIILFFYLILLNATAEAQCMPVNAPWSEGFEAWPAMFFWADHLCWENVAPTSSTDWNTDVSGSTPSSSTGPSGAHGGTNYIYFESSGGGPGVSADLISPEVNISTLTDPAIKFWYHMYGADMGTLSVEVSDNDGLTWTNLWSVSGEQHSSSASPWTKQVISLSGITGDTISIKFIAEDLNTGFKGDICLDDISVFECAPSYDTVNVSSCGNYVSPSGKLLNQSGVYKDTIPNAEGCDSIVTIYLTSLNTFSSMNISGCTYTTASGKKLTATGVYKDTITNAEGCDSIITYNYITSNTTSSIDMTVCDVYISPAGIQYDSSGLYVDTIVNAVGCDSLISIDLTVRHNQSLTLFVTKCYGEPYYSNSGSIYISSGIYIEHYTSVHGCDSSVTINLTSLDLVDTTYIDTTVCNAFVSGTGTVYDSTGVYTETFIAVNGCDSSIVYNVTVLINASVQQSISQSKCILSAEPNSSIYTYQWLDCNSAFAIIENETGPTFEVESLGTFTCRVSYENCADTADCIEVDCSSFLSTDDEVLNFSVHPNPGSEWVNINVDHSKEFASITLVDMQGRIVMIYDTVDFKNKVDVSSLSPGIYTVVVTGLSSQAEKKLIIR